MSRWIVGSIGVWTLLACSGAVPTGVADGVIPDLAEDPEEEPNDEGDGEDDEAEPRLDLVRGIYDRYQTDDVPTRKELPLSSQLQSSWKRGKAHVDFDPVIDGQDYEIGDIEVELDGDDVVVQFTNFGKETQVRWVMVEEGGRWVADDLRGEGWSLRKLTAK